MSQKNSTLPNKNIPRLRFGEFAGEWEEKKMGEVGDFLGGGTPSKKINNYWRGDIPWVSSSDISNENFIPSITRYITRSAIDNSATKIIPKNSILIVSRVGVGKLAINSNEICTSQDFTNFVPDKNINVLFSSYLLKSKKNKLLSFNQGTSIKGFTKKDLERMKLNFPPFVEQQKIASFLKSIDTWIENLKTEKEKLEQYKKGVMQKIFSQEFRFRNKNGDDFADWEGKQLGEVGEIIGGGTPDTTNNLYWGGEINWFTPSEIKNKYNKESLRKITKKGLNSSSARLLPKGTLLLTTRATIAEISFAKEECSTNQGFQSIVVNNYNNNEFIYNWILQNKKIFFRNANGSTFLEISGKEVKKLKISLPSLPEQKKIADFLSKIDNLIQLKQDQITKTKNWKKGVMQGVFV